MADLADRFGDAQALVNDAIARGEVAKMATSEKDARRLAETTETVGECKRCKFPFRRNLETGYVFEDVDGYCSNYCHG